MDIGTILKNARSATKPGGSTVYNDITLEDIFKRAKDEGALQSHYQYQSQ